MDTSSAAKDLRRRRIYAVLAGGLVLGVGTAVTLAAWNDSEFAKSTFTAGSFVFQGSTDGTAFADHASEAGAADLTFVVNPTNLSPGDTVYAPYAVKLTGSSAADLTQTVAIASGGTLVAADLVFDAVATTAFGCDATAFNAGTAIPDALTKAVSELAQARKDAGRYRTEKNETGEKVAQLEEQFAKIAKHLGIKDETPEAIAQALTKERDDLAAENRTLKVGQALTKAARDAKADEDSLLDSRAFMAEVEKLDPSKDDFADELKKLVETAVKDNPKLKAQAARSGNDLSGGGAGNGDRPRSLEDAVAARLGG